MGNASSNVEAAIRTATSKVTRKVDKLLAGKADVEAAVREMAEGGATRVNLTCAVFA